MTLDEYEKMLAEKQPKKEETAKPKVQDSELILHVQPVVFA